MKQVMLTLALCPSGSVALADDLPKVPPAKEPELQRELLRRTKADQEARNTLFRWMNQHGSNGVVVPATLSAEQKAEFERINAALKKADEENTKWLKATVAKHGWPTITLVGEDGAKAAWLLVQHADADPKFQRTCLDLMARLPKEEVSPSNRAYSTDRVLLAEGKKQLYGTEFMFVDGKLKPRPLEDEAAVDRRRAEVGLPPLAEYLKVLEKQYGSGPKK